MKAAFGIVSIHGSFPTAPVRWLLIGPFVTSVMHDSSPLYEARKRKYTSCTLHPKEMGDKVCSLMGPPRTDDSHILWGMQHFTAWAVMSYTGIDRRVGSQARRCHSLTAATQHQKPKTQFTQTEQGTGNQCLVERSTIHRDKVLYLHFKLSKNYWDLILVSGIFTT